MGLCDGPSNARIHPIIDAQKHMKIEKARRDLSLASSPVDMQKTDVLWRKNRAFSLLKYPLWYHQPPAQQQ